MSYFCFLDLFESNVFDDKDSKIVFDIFLRSFILFEGLPFFFDVSKNRLIFFFFNKASTLGSFKSLCLLKYVRHIGVYQIVVDVLKSGIFKFGFKNVILRPNCESG